MVARPGFRKALFLHKNETMERVQIMCQFNDIASTSETTAQAPLCSVSFIMYLKNQALKTYEESGYEATRILNVDAR